MALAIACIRSVPAGRRSSHSVSPIPKAIATNEQTRAIRTGLSAKKSSAAVSQEEIARRRSPRRRGFLPQGAYRLRPRLIRTLMRVPRESRTPGRRAWLMILPFLILAEYVRLGPSGALGGGSSRSLVAAAAADDHFDPRSAGQPHAGAPALLDDLAPLHLGRVGACHSTERTPLGREQPARLHDRLPLDVRHYAPRGRWWRLRGGRLRGGRLRCGRLRRRRLRRRGLRRRRSS